MCSEVAVDRLAVKIELNIVINFDLESQLAIVAAHQRHSPN